MNSQRFFIALVPPPEIQTSIDDIRKHFKQHYGSSKAFNSPPHITLQAPFKWDCDRDLDKLTSGLGPFAAKKQTIDISLRNFGAFPPKVIYVDVVQSPGLMNLQKELAEFMKVHHGVENKRYRSFCPHMTVAFRDLTKTAFQQAWPEFQTKSIAFDFMAQNLTLLKHDGQRWQIEQNYPLKK